MRQLWHLLRHPIALLILSFCILPAADAQEWSQNSDFNAELKYSAKYKPFKEGRVTHFRPLGLVEDWAYDSETNVLFGAHPKAFKSADSNQIVRYRVSDNTILERYPVPSYLKRLVLKNRRLVACCTTGTATQLVVFDVDTNEQISKFETDLKRVTDMFCSQAGNDFVYLVHDRKPTMISQFDIAKGKVVKAQSASKFPGYSISPDGKWVGRTRRAATFDEATMTCGEVAEFRSEKRIVSEPKFQHWAVREQKWKDDPNKKVPTPLRQRKDGTSWVSYALHPSINILAEGYFTQGTDRDRKISFGFGIRFSNVKFDNTLANVRLSVPPEKSRLERGYSVSLYNESVQDMRLSTTNFDEEDRLAIVTMGPHAYVIHLNETILGAAAPPKMPAIAQSGPGDYYAYPGEKVAFDVSITENGKGTIGIIGEPDGLEFEKGSVAWTPKQSDIGVYRLRFDASVNRKRLRDEAVITVMPMHLDLKGKVEVSKRSFDGSRVAYVTERGRLKYLVVVDTKSREIIKETKINVDSTFSRSGVDGMWVNKGHVFIKSRSNLTRIEIKTGDKQSVSLAALDGIDLAYLDQLDRLVVSGKVPNKMFYRSFVLNSNDLEIVKDDVRNGLLVAGSSNHEYPHVLGPIEDAFDQTSKRKLVRHFGSIVDLDQNRFVSLSRWQPNGALYFALPTKGKGKTGAMFPGFYCPRWGGGQLDFTKAYSRPFRIGTRSFRTNRTPVFGSGSSRSGFAAAGSNVSFSTLDGKLGISIPAFRFDDNRKKRNLAASPAKDRQDLIKKFPRGNYDEVTEVVGKDIFLASKGSQLILFHPVPDKLKELLKYPLTLVNPEVTQLRLERKPTINFKTVGEQTKIKFSLNSEYQHLSIDEGTGALTIDGDGIRNAWLDANFPTRLAKGKPTAKDLQRSLARARELSQDKLNHAKFVGVPVPQGYHPVQFTFGVQVENLVENLEKLNSTRDAFDNVDINLHKANMTIVGLINEKVIAREVENIQRALRN